MRDSEYLVSFGNSGDFSRFRAAPSATYARGTGWSCTVLRGSSLAGCSARRPMNTSAFFRIPQSASCCASRTKTTSVQPRGREVGRQVFEEARQLVAEQGLPLEIVDVELQLDGRQATIYHLRPVDCDYRPLVSTLARRHDVLIVMENLALPPEEKTEGCGKPDCGQAGGGGCSSCGSGGGCSSGSCGKHFEKDQVAQHLAALQSDAPDRARTALL